ncbi:MAG TPA: PIG-L family deacetylase [Pyrinomonadaceae bacterium]|jgi:LmbE family N-acetylglucosaminyl deacetylase|nr:PIG-L family deacetylase [Pyrinomonadaceae bacterium]
MNPYEQFVKGMAGLLAAAESYPLGGFAPPVWTAPAEGAPAVLIFAPHPDDEVIIGALPLRLQRELGARVLNVAVTLGSDRGRRAGRLAELRGACEYLGFGLLEASEGGLENITRAGREEAPEGWAEAVEGVGEILLAHRPLAVFFPHEADANSTHTGTHLLVRDALKRAGKGFSCFTFETEFWHPMTGANLLVESSVGEVADLVTALTFHAGEVRRNPYHLRLPAWMMDNVRRGGEVVGRQGGEPPRFAFGTIYRAGRWEGGRPVEAAGAGRFVGSGDDLSALFAMPGAGDHS